MRNGFLFISLFMLVGCSDLFVKHSEDGNKPSPGPTPILKHASAVEVWETLAQYVDNKIVSTVADLAEYAKVLFENSDLTQGDLGTFDIAFPKAPTDQRALTPEDASKLRSLK